MAIGITSYLLMVLGCLGSLDIPVYHVLKIILEF